MSRPDKRPQFIQNALAHPDLGAAERVFVITVVLTKTEFNDGVRRRGSRGMDERGNFALHYDYLAEALHTSPDNVKKLTQRLVSKGWLSKRHPGTYARPAGFQLLDVRGDTMSLHTLRGFVPPYAMDDPPPRGDTTSPLPYRTPVGPDQAPTSRVSRTAQIAASSSQEDWTEGRKVGARLTACAMHGWDECPPWCHELPESREVS